MTEKTQAMRALEGKRISYEVLPYPESMRDAEEIAIVLNLVPDEVFKTLVVLPPEAGKKPMLVMLPANKQLDTKKLAEVVAVKKVKLASHKEAEQLTELQVGGISAVALLNKPFSVYLDESAKRHAQICISAGKRGFQLKVGVEDLIKLTNARVHSIASDTGA